MGPSLEQVLEWVREAYPLIYSLIGNWVQVHPEHWGYLEEVCRELPLLDAVQVIFNLWYDPYGIASL